MQNPFIFSMCKPVGFKPACDKPIENKMESDDKPALSGYYETLQQAIEDKLESGDFQLPILPVIASKLIGKLSRE